MELNNKKKRTACAVIIITAITLIITACTYPFGKVSLEFKTTESGANIPQMSGLVKDDEVNSQLSDIFTPYAEQAQEAVEDSDGRLTVVYDMTESENSSVFNPEYTISMSISDGSYSINVASATVGGFSNVTASAPAETPWLSSADIIISMMDLNQIGFSIDLSELNGEADEEFAVEFFIDLYEAFTESELDISDIAVGDVLGDEYKKALKLGLVTDYSYADDYEYSTQADWSLILKMTGALIEDIERDVYGRQSESVTGQEFSDMLRTMYSVCLAEEFENSEYRWEELGEVDFNAVISDAEMYDSELTRRDAAEILFRITREGPGYNINYSDNRLIDVEDSESIWVRRVITYDLMDYYGDSTLFAPNEGLTVVNAIDTADRYIYTRYSDWLFATGYEDNILYSKYDVMLAAGKIAEYFKERPDEQKNSFETITVINDRDYDWFYSQQNTGEYSSVNCMPSIATMAAHWYNEQSGVTVEKMRNTSEETGGWTAVELRNGLEYYDIPYDIVDANMDNILEALDNGKIVLAQYSDRPYEMSGHCYVIYGYRKFNNSVTFIINDSDSLVDRSTIFGRSKGNGDEVEANFAMWSIERFVSDVTVVG